MGNIQSDHDQNSAMVNVHFNYDQNTKIMPTTRLCFYCSKEGKEHPIEHFLRYPCCGYFICKDCMRSNSQFCGECLTNIPTGNKHAILWLEGIKMRSCNDRSRKQHLRGRIMVFGTQLFLDELLFTPVYRYKKLEPSCQILAFMSPTCVDRGVDLLKEAAEDEVISAMLDLADIYCTNFVNDTFRQDKKKAEEWYVKALGKGDSFFPLAFTHYGDFLIWDQRFKEARNMYAIAAKHGHSRGQYEYAVCLLEGIGSNENDRNGNESVSNDKREEAIEFLCTVCEKGFYAPAYTYLAKALIKIAEEAYGTVFPIGKSPVPRVLQTLKLGKDCLYGNTEVCEKETMNLIEYHKKRKDKCSNCGQAGSEAYPLRSCETCDSVAYCSKICQKRDYRDGHKFDCCSRSDLFCFKSVRLTLPWVNKAGWKRDGIQMPYLSAGTRKRSLIQMVEDETDEVYGEEDQDYDDYILINLMMRMRQNLETFLNRELQPYQPNSSPPPLQHQIDSFAKKIGVYPEQKGFIDAMNTIRKLGNSAAHDSKLEANRLEKIECENAVEEFRLQKEKYMRYKERNESFRDVNTPPIISKGNDDAGNVSDDICDATKYQSDKKDAMTIPLKSNRTVDMETKDEKENENSTEQNQGFDSTKDTKSNENETQMASPNPIALKEAAERLSRCIQNKDVKGLEDFESEFKGVPGFAKLRKRAKDEAKKMLMDVNNRISQCVQNKDLKGLEKIKSEFMGVPGFGKLRQRAKNEAKKLLMDSNNRISQCVQNKDLKGLEEIDSQLKGVPGFAKLRKRAKDEATKLLVDQGIEVIKSQLKEV